MPSPHIQRSLERSFARHRVVFWYDPNREWKEEVDEMGIEDVEVVSVDNNEIGLKFRMLLDEPKKKFLVYTPAERPNDEKNWLVDVLLSNTEFHADRASLHLQETGLPPEYRSLAVEHAAFFSRKDRREALKSQIENDETHRTIRRRMMAILAKAQDHSLDAILLQMCERLAGAPLLDPVEDTFKESDLVAAFWREVEVQYGYQSASPSLLDFVIGLFQHNAPLGGQSHVKLRTQAVVFLSRWKDSNSSRQSFTSLSDRTAQDLNVAAALNKLSPKELQALVDGEVDAYEAIEQCLLCWFRDGVLKRSWEPDTRRKIIEKRARSVWFGKYEPLYEALNHGAELLDQVQKVMFDVDTLDQAISRYQATWWGIDFHYRKFHACRRASPQPGLLDEIEVEVEKRYLNGYLNPLATRWESLLDQHPTWPPSMQPRSRDFYRQVVKPGAEGRQKLVVIISDGLRYECAVELAQRMQQESKFTAEMDGRLAPLPSYTQLGMASLLPHKELSVAEGFDVAYADNQSTAGIDGRKKVLASDEGLKLLAITSEEFINLNTMTEGRPMMKECDALYVYHNEIDKAGDALATEKTTATACDSAIETLIKLIKKATNLNVANIVVTADHGFLFQQSAVEDVDCISAPTDKVIGKPNRRFLMGNGLKSDSSLRVYSASDVGLAGDFDVGITKGLQRLKVKGAGKRYVHGGAMPQEVLVPVLSINKAKVDDIRHVAVVIQSYPSPITTMNVSIRLFQKDVVDPGEKILGRELELGIFSSEGELLSDQKSVRFESTDSEPRSREVVISLTLGHRVTDFNNEQLELRLQERIGSTTHSKIYATAQAKFVKPFESEIDEF